MSSLPQAYNACKHSAWNDPDDRYTLSGAQDSHPIHRGVQRERCDVRDCSGDFQERASSIQHGGGQEDREPRVEVGFLGTSEKKTCCQTMQKLEDYRFCLALIFQKTMRPSLMTSVLNAALHHAG